MRSRAQLKAIFAKLRSGLDPTGSQRRKKKKGSKSKYAAPGSSFRPYGGTPQYRSLQHAQDAMARRNKVK